MGLLKKVANIYNKIEEYFLVASIVFTVLTIFYQVIMRFVFNDSPSWTEETCRYVFIWQIWMGASAGLKDGQHIRLDLIKSSLIKHSQFFANNIVELIVLIIWILLTILLTVGGIDLVQQMAARNALSPALRAPVAIVYAALPVSCGICTLRLAYLIIIEARKLLKGGMA